MDGIHQQLMAEAQRRFSGQGASSAGIGAEAANSPSSGNPLAQRGLVDSQPNTGNATMPTAENPSAGAISMQKNAAPGEAMIITKALIARLKQHPVQAV